MEKPLVFIIILFIGEMICLILFLNKYPEIQERKYHQITRDIYEAEEKEDNQIVREFENIFGKLCKGGSDFSCFDIGLRTIITYIICIIIGILSSIGSFAYCCSKNNKKGALVVFIISGLLNMNNIDLAFQKDEVNFDGNIYLYDDDLNNRIKKAINMVYTRSSYLKATSILISIIIIAQIFNLYLLKDKEDNDNNISNLNAFNQNERRFY